MLSWYVSVFLGLRVVEIYCHFFFSVLFDFCFGAYFLVFWQIYFKTVYVTFCNCCEPILMKEFLSRLDVLKILYISLFVSYFENDFDYQKTDHKLFKTPMSLMILIFSSFLSALRVFPFLSSLLYNFVHPFTGLISVHDLLFTQHLWS